MNKYKIYGGLKYLIHDGKKQVFKFISYEEKKTKKNKKYRRRTRRRNRH